MESAASEQSTEVQGWFACNKLEHLLPALKV
jgi:hypothetical protein